MWKWLKNILLSFAASHLKQLKVPEYAQKDVIETDMFHTLHDFLHRKPLGIHVLWTPSSTGKTTTICSINASDVVYWNCHSRLNFDKWFWEKIYLEPKSKLACEVLKHSPRMTLVIDGYYNLVTYNASLEWLSQYMSVLVVCDFHEDALQTLRDYSGAKLIGRPYCGHWTPRITAFHHYLWYVKTEYSWMIGEEALKCYREQPGLSDDLPEVSTETPCSQPA